MSETGADSQPAGHSPVDDPAGSLTESEAEPEVEPEPEPEVEPEAEVGQSATVASGQSWIQQLRDRVTTWPGVASIAIAMTVVGSWAPWSVDGQVRLGGLEGSHDGWLAALYALAAFAAVKPLSRRSWPATTVMLICGLAVLVFTLGGG
jgi:hypothetical protein